MENGKLYIVATPIGNLEDITYRAVRVLSEADLIAAEDTRTSSVLLHHYGINTRTTSLHKFNENSKAAQLIERIKAGESIALISDAGTPGVSDPAHSLIGQAIREGIEPEVIPGPAAYLCAALLSGFPLHNLVFKGFFPRDTKGRKQLFTEIDSLIQLNDTYNFAFYESPKRIIKTLAILEEGYPLSQISVSREITKKFEETVRGEIGEVISHIEQNVFKGEISFIINPAKESVVPDKDAMNTEIMTLLEAGHKTKEVSLLLSDKYGLNKQELYKQIVDIKNTL